MNSEEFQTNKHSFGDLDGPIQSEYKLMIPRLKPETPRKELTFSRYDAANTFCFKVNS